MAKLIDAGDGMFIDPEPVAAPDGMLDAHVYAYAQLHSLERVSYGLMLTTSGPEDEEIESMKVGSFGIEPLDAGQLLGQAALSDGAYSDEVEEYETEEMVDAAKHAIEFMFGGDEWEMIYRDLVAAN